MTTSLSAEHFRTTKYGKLRMTVPTDSSRGSHRKVDWVCDCGKTTNVAVCTVVSGNTSSCRKCNMLLEEDLRTRKFGKLRLKEPRDLLPGSRTKVVWLCDCGRETLCQPLSVTTGHTTTCGKCDIPDKEYYETTKFGKLRMEFPESISLGNRKKVSWLCDCGNKTMAALYAVTPGHTSSCGKCRHSDPEYWAKESYGRLQMLEPGRYSCGSNQRVKWRCLCGAETEQDVYTVTSGKVRSCGRCMVAARSWFEDNKLAILALRFPARPDEVPSGWIYPLEAIRGHDSAFRALCGSCKQEYAPIWGNIRKGSSLTCGCASNQTSGTSVALAKFVESLGAGVVMEHKSGEWKYDVFVPSSNLVIEYNGHRWHSLPGSRERDRKKYDHAVSAGLDYLSFFEDEWAFGRPKVENLLRNRLLRSSPKSLRPSQCEVTAVDSSVAAPFYDEHHYIGACLAKVHIGALHEGKLVASASFSVPTRQSRHPWELLRMAGDPEYRVHGIWSKLLGKFVEEHRPLSVVSFSDNRLFSGGVYGKIGFRLDGEIPPDYYWTKGGKRFHKSGLRKREGEKASGLTESQLREAQGYSKVWDLGKKRWVFTP